MNVLHTGLAIGLIAVAVFLTIFTEGMLLPFMLPLFAYALKLMGVKLNE